METATIVILSARVACTQIEYCLDCCLSDEAGQTSKMCLRGFLTQLERRKSGSAPFSNRESTFLALGVLHLVVHALLDYLHRKC